MIYGLVSVALSSIERIQEDRIKVHPYKACAETLIPSPCYASILTFTHDLIIVHFAYPVFIAYVVFVGCFCNSNNDNQ